MNVQDLTEIEKCPYRESNLIANCIMDYALSKHEPQTYASYDVEQEFCSVVYAICDIAGYDNETGRELICGTYLADALSDKGDTAYKYNPSNIEYNSSWADKVSKVNKPCAGSCFRDAHYNLYMSLGNKYLNDNLLSQNIDLGDDFAQYWDHYMFIKTNAWGINYHF